MISIDQLNAEQTNALDALLSGENVFLTGDAGTGKTTVMKIFIDEMEKRGKNVLVTATTGVAATNLGDGAMTIHRALNISIDMSKYKSKVRQRPPLLQVADVLIIDEISMCRFDLFNVIYKIVCLENEEREVDRFIGESDKEDLQVVVVGDFFQLPPVITANDRKALAMMYGDEFLPGREKTSGYAFYSEHWKDMQFYPVELHEICRQTGDEGFTKVINDIKYGKNIRKSINYLENNSSPKKFNTVTLVGKNAEADQINIKRLKALDPATEVTYWAKFDGLKIEEKDLKNINLALELTLNIGAKVMCTMNSSNGDYVNGTIGTIKDFGRNFGDDYVEIVTNRGNTIRVYKTEKDIIKQVIEEEFEDVKREVDGKTIIEKVPTQKIVRKKVGTITQFPLKLAWAISVHKSQGQTFDAVNIIPDFWEVGQFYVAVSRAKTIRGINFMSPIKQTTIKAFSKEDRQKLHENCTGGLL